MNHINGKNLRVNVAGILLSAIASLASAAGFVSGSTGADGAFSPTANTTLNMPPSGIFHFTTVDIPAGVTVRFAKNATNTPVTILATGNASIAGTIDVSGGNSLTSGPGTLGDRTVPGIGGPGGYNGGRGGMPEINRRGGNGLGPGGGGGGDAISTCCNPFGGALVVPQGGGGGGYGVPGISNPHGATAGNTGLGGTSYGSNLLTPLVGGSGGGGGAGGQSVDGFYGTGGGGGGGAILIAATGMVTLTGSILAKGGDSGSFSSGASGTTYAATGGGGSGGAVRVVAANILNSGTVNVTGGTAGHNSMHTYQNGGNGGRGRTSFEIVAAGTLSLTGLPTLSFTSVAGVAAPAAPTGAGDVILPAASPNPATVVFATTGIPVGNTVALRLTPNRGAAITATSTPLAGSLANATASAEINIPQGTSMLMASTTYTITVAQGEALSRFANNERVEKITLSATPGSKSTATLVTVSGKEYDAPAEALRIATVQ